MQTCSAVDGSTLNFSRNYCWPIAGRHGLVPEADAVRHFRHVAPGYRRIDRSVVGLAALDRSRIGLSHHFAVLYTSVFTNLGGWGNGMVESLGYWLVQQEVARGGREFYYLLVVPFYEFLPVIFSLAAIFFWFRKTQFQRTDWFWVLLFIVAAIAYSFSTDLQSADWRHTAQPRLITLTLGIIGAWLAFRWLRRNLNLDDPVFAGRHGVANLGNSAGYLLFATLPINGAVREEPVSWPGILTALLVVVLGGAVWFRSYRQQNGIRPKFLACHHQLAHLAQRHPV